MKQVCLVKGVVEVVEVPPPACGPRDVLVRTSASLISTGTELSISAGGGGAIGRAMASPELVRKVWTKVGEIGPRRTLDLIRARQSTLVPLGYSTAGEVIDVGEKVRRFKVGDHVACAGAGHANHAEINAVPQNLVARAPEDLEAPRAAFATVGAIALHSVRRLAPTLGEQVVVVGLGLIGQMAAQMLRTSGSRAFGIDPRAARVELARALGLEDGTHAGGIQARTAVEQWTGGTGADAVLVCASGGDASVLNQALDLCRKKGRVVLVGDVPIRLSRDKLYRKEIDFLISCSYGPGRYDVRYERGGQDYPLPYVRWTEGRNLAEVVRLLATGQLRVSELIGATRPIAEAPRAYTDLREPDAPIAVVLSYETETRTSAPALARRSATAAPLAIAAADRVVLGVIGAGTFFRSVHLPNLRRHGGFELKRVVSRSGLHARQLAVRERIPESDTDARRVIDDPDITAVLIATRHDLHAPLALECIRAGKHIFVEKPLGLSVAQCESVVTAADAAGVLVTVGFNRRLAPLALAARAALAQVREPRTLLYRVNAGPLPPDHWLLDPVEGGGRLLGEVVHFFDFARWLVGGDPVRVHASALDRNQVDLDSITATLAFADGSLATIVYASRGHTGLAKERVEIFGGGHALVLDDFARLEIHGPGARTRRSSGRVDKGHAGLLANFHDAIVGRAALAVTARDGYWATWCAVNAQRSAIGLAPSATRGN